MILRSRITFVPIVFAFIAGGCGTHGGGDPLSVVPMQIGSKTFELEVAATHQAEEKGLMQRDSMPEEHGMIFVMPEERVVNFWMKNTRFDLDILFLDHGGTVVSIHQMKAYDENMTSSDNPAKYAIELNAGAAKNAGVKVGDNLQIPPAVRDAKTN